MKSKEKMVHTEEDWYPSFFQTSNIGGTARTVAMVKVSLHKRGANDYWVSIWGADDFGVERQLTDLTEALNCYRGIRPLVKRAKLLNDGFLPA